MWEAVRLLFLFTRIVDLIRYVVPRLILHNADPRRAHGRGDRSYRITIHMNLLKRRDAIHIPFIFSSAVIVIIFQCDYHLTLGFFTSL